VSFGFSITLSHPLDTSQAYFLISSMNEAIYTQLHENIRGLLSTFFQWYTFFWTLNMAALAWIYAKQDSLSPSVNKNRALVAGLFVLLNVLGTCSSLVMILAIVRLSDGNASFVQLFASKGDPASLETSRLIKLGTVPTSVYVYAFVTCALSTALMGTFWGLMYYHDRPRNRKRQPPEEQVQPAAA
jgi:hypothetical protein